MKTLLPVDKIPVTSTAKWLPWLDSIESDAKRMHAQLGLNPPPQHAPDTPLVVAAEQMGVELRPATLYKLMILEQLGRRGMRAVFMFEECDVASKDKRLRGWALPHLSHGPDQTVASAAVQRISPLGPQVTARSLHNRPLAHVPITADHAQAAAAITALYRPLVDKSHRKALEQLVQALMNFLAERTAGATTLAQLGQHQLAHVATRLGIRHVSFCKLAAIEEPLLASGTAGLQALLPLEQAIEAGLMPADLTPFWGRHLGDCHGRVKVQTDLQASCLRCGDTLPRQAWQPLSLRASIRMLALQQLGVDLFVAGGSSGYNSGIRDFQHQHGRAYLPLAWHAGISYAGPAQLASAQIATETESGSLSLIDAFIGSNFSDPRGIFHAATLADPLQGAFERLATCMQDSLAEHGVSYLSGAAAPRPNISPEESPAHDLELCA